MTIEYSGEYENQIKAQRTLSIIVPSVLFIIFLLLYIIYGNVKEAAHVILTRVSKWSKLKAWAVGVAKRRGAKRAKVALARKLGIVLHRMWIDATDFRWGQAA